MIESTKFRLITDGPIIAFTGSGNTERLSFEPLDNFSYLTLSDKGYLDLAGSNCSRIEVKLDNQVLSSEDAPITVTFSDDEVFVKFGTLTVIQSSLEFHIIGYFGTDITEGVVLCHGERITFQQK